MSRVTKWTREKVEQFRVWHEAILQELYASSPAVQQELRKARERWLLMVMP